MPLKYKPLILAFFLISQTLFATENTLVFSTTLSNGQIEETVTIKFSGSTKNCKLHIKESLLSHLFSKFDVDYPSDTDSCHFQPTKRVHTYSITGFLKEEGENGPAEIEGEGKGTILNIADDYKALESAQNIDDLFQAYDNAVTKINAELPKNEQLSALTFEDKEKAESVSRYLKDNDLALPKAYIKMITQYGYPTLNNFIPLSKQRSIATVYESDYDYSRKQYNSHKGIEKNKVFYQESENVYYIFQDNAKAVGICDGEPLVIYTIATEGDYSPENLKGILQKTNDCSGFFKFIKGQFVDHFIENIGSSISHVLPIYKNKPLKAELTYDSLDNDTLDYYFNYNDIFY